MPTKRQRQLQDGKEMTLGGLFLVDNAPERPEEMSWHDFSNKAIAEHLERHSYYCTEKGKRDLVTVAKMRSRINNMCNNYAKPTMPKPNKLGREFKDKVDVLFGFGRSELLKKDFLDLLGYEKGSFPQSRLNKHVSEVDTSGEASIARRPEDTPASAKTGGRPEGEMAEENHGSGISKTSSRDAGEDERRESEAGVAAPPPYSQLFHHLRAMWAHHLNHQKMPMLGLSRAWSATARGMNRMNQLRMSSSRPRRMRVGDCEAALIPGLSLSVLTTTHLSQTRKRILRRLKTSSACKKSLSGEQSVSLRKIMGRTNASVKPRLPLSRTTQMSLDCA